jgi:hypothetical protein
MERSQKLWIHAIFVRAWIGKVYYAIMYKLYLSVRPSHVPVSGIIIRLCAASFRSDLLKLASCFGQRVISFLESINSVPRDDVSLTKTLVWTVFQPIWLPGYWETISDQCSRSKCGAFTCILVVGPRATHFTGYCLSHYLFIVSNLQK